MNRSLYFWKDQDQSEELCLNANQTLVHMLAAVSVRIWSTWEVLSTDKGKSSSQKFPRASHILSPWIYGWRLEHLIYHIIFGKASALNLK